MLFDLFHSLTSRQPHPPVTIQMVRKKGMRKIIIMKLVLLLADQLWIIKVCSLEERIAILGHNKIPTDKKELKEEMDSGKIYYIPIVGSLTTRLLTENLSQESRFHPMRVS